MAAGGRIKVLVDGAEGREIDAAPVPFCTDRSGLGMSLDCVACLCTACFAEDVAKRGELEVAWQRGSTAGRIHARTRRRRWVCVRGQGQSPERIGREGVTTTTALGPKENTRRKKTRPKRKWNRRRRAKESEGTRSSTAVTRCVYTLLHSVRVICRPGSAQYRWEQRRRMRDNNNKSRRRTQDDTHTHTPVAHLALYIHPLKQASMRRRSPVALKMHACYILNEVGPAPRFGICFSLAPRRRVTIRLYCTRRGRAA